MNLLIQLIEIFRLIIFVAVIISWVAPGSQHPAVNFIRQLTEPVFQAVRKVIPPMNGIDLSPIVVILGLSLLTRIL